MEDDVTPVDRVVSMLEDDAYRTGGCIQYGSLLRLAEKFSLSTEDVLVVRSRLISSGIEIDGDPAEATSEESSETPSEPGEPTSAAMDGVGAYLKAAGGFELLRRDEETELMRRIRAGENAAKLLTEGRPDPNGALAGFREDGIVARDHFLHANMRLVMFVAKDYAKITDGLTLDDLLQEGSIGLLHAMDKFNHNLGFKFSTYAIWWVRQAITRALADKNGLVRVPVHVQELAAKVRRTQRAVARERGGQLPSTHEIATQLGLSPEKVQFLLDLEKSPVSLDSPAKAGESARLADTLVSMTTPNPHDLTFLHERKRELDSALSDLKPREQDVIRQRFDGEKSLEEIGQGFKVTRERVRQIEEKAIGRLRHRSRAKRLAELIDFVPNDDAEETPENRAKGEVDKDP
jgi:RNA polymerase primary sigma factor